jgi:hypothetical protein
MLDPNDTTTRIIDAQEDDNAGQIDPAVMFAVAAGRPELLELHRTEETVGALRLEQRIWGDEQFTLKATVEQNRRTITGLRRSITDLDQVLARRCDTRGDAFRITLDGTTFDSRADAGIALVRRLHAAVHADRGRQQVQLGELGGITLSAGVEPGLLGDRALLRLDGIPDSMIELTQRDLDTLAAGSGQDQVGLIRKLENRLAGADDLRQRYTDSIDRLQANLDRATARIGLPFPRQADLDRHTEQLAELHKQLLILDVASPDRTPDGAAAPSTRHGASDPGTRRADPGPSKREGGRPAAPAGTTPPSHGYTGTTPPELWAVTVTEPSNDRPRTTLATAQLMHQELQASSRDPGTTLDRDGDRTTVRDPDGTVSYTAAPIDPPWRAWQPGEADHVDLGPGLVWHLRLAPDGRFASTLGGPGDARRVLRQAQADGSPVAVTDWGVLTVYQHRPVAYVRQDAAIPDVPEVPAATAEPTHPDRASSTVAPAAAGTVQEALDQAGVPADQQQWLIGQLQHLVDEPGIQMVARANDYDHARLVLDDKLDEVLVDAVEASDIDGMALAAQYFDDDGRAFRRPFREAASTELYQRARTAAEAATTPDQVSPSNTPPEPAQHHYDLPTRDTNADRPDPPGATVQPKALPETQRRRRGHPFYPPADILATIPPLYGTEGQPAEDKTLCLHYFGGSHDIWLAEYDPATGEGFGYVSIGDPDNAEWGYVSLPEVEQVNHGLVIIERDLHWTPVTASQANLPGWRAPRPAAALTTAPSTAPPTAPSAVAADVIEPDQHPDGDPGTNVEQVEATPTRATVATPPEPPDLTPIQKAVIDELGKERAEPWSIGRQWRIRTFDQVSADDLAALPADVRQALTADIRESLSSPAGRERATARRLLDRWSGNPTTLTDAQGRAVDAVCMPATSYDMPDTARLGHYGRLTAEEFLTLDPGYQHDIKADLKAIGDSGATKTIPRNRSGIGATVRTVADHVAAAQNLLHRLGSDLAVRPLQSNAATVGRTVVGLRLNSGDQVQLRGRLATVDRVGIDLQVHLVGGGTLPDSTRRYRLVAAGPDPVTDNSSSRTVTEDPTPNPAPVSGPAATADIAAAPAAERTEAAGHDGQHGADHAQAAAAHADQPATQPTLFDTPPTGGPTTPAAAGPHPVIELTAEQRLLNKVAARVPADVVQRTDTPDGRPTVLLAFVANGTYGQVTGLDLQRQPITASGYVIEAQGLRGGYGGWHPDTLMLVELGELPDGPVLHTVQTEMDARLTVLDPPRPDMPAGEAAPWLRMPVEEQILAARTALGLRVEVRDGPANELWTVQGCPEQLTGEVARWLFGGRYHSWHGRARPVFRPELVQEAIAAGRIPAEPQPASVSDTPQPLADVEARIARLRPYTEPGPQFRRAVAEALTYAQMKLDAGLDPTGDLLEGEVSADLRSRADLAAWRTNEPPPMTTVPASPVPAPQPAWLAGVVLGEETPTADGRHQAQRRTSRNGMTVYVEARHPQLGMLPRGRIDLAPRADSGDPAPRWQIVDQDSSPVGEHTGPYAEAEAQLLAATVALDESLSDQEVAELTAEADPHPDAGHSQGIDAFATVRGASAPDAPAGQSDPDPAAVGGATAPAPPAVATTAGADAAVGGRSNTPSWSDRIEVVDGPTLIVRGTTGARREEGLRGLLKQYRFRYQRAGGEWRYAGRPADRVAAIGDIRRWLTAQDRADAARASNPTAALPPTEQQQRIIDAYQDGHTIAVQALAGTGKTSTLQMLAAARPQTRVAYIAFNRSIADEAQRKFGRNVRADTSHAFAREALSNTPLRGKLARVGQGARWPAEWVHHLHIAVDGEQAPLPDSVARMVMATVRNFRESAADTIGREHLAGSIPDEVPGLAQAVLDYARVAWQDIADPDGQLLFDHDDYLKLWALDNPCLPYDVIFFDEAQDINDVLRRVIQDQPAQTIVVGDSNQSIYGFRGAIDALKNWPAQNTLPLTQSWRFGPAVAQVGNQFLGLLKSPWLLTGNPALDSSVGPVDDPDAILARTNAGAVAAVFDAFDDGKRVALMGGGRAIEDIAKAAKDLQAGRGTKHPDLSRFADWDEVRSYVEDGEDAQSLRAFVRLVDRRSADGLLQMVKELINEDQTGPEGNPDYDVIVSTVHKAKGREWGQIRIADDFPQPQENQTTRHIVLPSDEQLRLAYVAVTRARHRLELGSLRWIDDLPDQPRPARVVAAAVAPTKSPAAQPPPPSTGTDASPVEAAAAPEPLRRFTTVEQATIRNVVTDHAAGYHGGPLGLGSADAARYTSEAHLKDLVAEHGLSAVWDAVAAVINTDPSVLSHSPAQRAEAQTTRQAHAERLAAQALDAFKANDFTAAEQLVAEAELLDPTYRSGRSERRPHGTGWTEIRQAIARRRDEMSQAGNESLGQPKPGSPLGFGEWLATRPFAADIPDDQRHWLAQQVYALTTDPTVRQAARLDSEDDFGLVFDPALERRLMDMVDADPENQAGLLYFRDDEFAVALNAFARHAVHQAVQDNPNTTEVPVAASADTNPPVNRRAAAPSGEEAGIASITSPEPLTPQNAAQLARLDSAAGAQYRSTSRERRNVPHGAQPAPARRLPGL